MNLPTQVRHAPEGIECPYCESRQPSTSLRCGECGADLTLLVCLTNLREELDAVNSSGGGRAKNLVEATLQAGTVPADLTPGRRLEGKAFGSGNEAAEVARLESIESVKARIDKGDKKWLVTPGYAILGGAIVFFSMRLLGTAPPISAEKNPPSTGTQRTDRGVNGDSANKIDSNDRIKGAGTTEFKDGHDKVNGKVPILNLLNGVAAIEGEGHPKIRWEERKGILMASGFMATRFEEERVKKIIRNLGDVPIDTHQVQYTGRTLVVRGGDSLWNLARREYGDGNLYTYLRGENGQVLKTDKISEGQKIEAPSRRQIEVDRNKVR